MLTIRAANERADRAELEACVVELQNIERAWNPDMPEGKAIAEAYVRQMWSDSREYAGKISIAELDNVAVGFVSVLAKYPSEDIDDPGEYGLISDVVVLARYRGLGIGTKLLQTAENHVRSQGVSRLRIHALAENVGARSLYNKLGFRDFEIELEKRLDVSLSSSEQDDQT